jgi:hypothetical protein
MLQCRVCFLFIYVLCHVMRVLNCNGCGTSDRGPIWDTVTEFDWRKLGKPRDRVLGDPAENRMWHLNNRNQKHLTLFLILLHDVASQRMFLFLFTATGISNPKQPAPTLLRCLRNFGQSYCCSCRLCFPVSPDLFNLLAIWAQKNQTRICIYIYSRDLTVCF